MSRAKVTQQAQQVEENTRTPKAESVPGGRINHPGMERRRDTDPQVTQGVDTCLKVSYLSVKEISTHICIFNQRFLETDVAYQGILDE